MPATADPTGNHPLQTDQGRTSAQDLQPERVVLRAEDFDALASRLEQPGRYDPRVARVLSRKAPWD